MSEANTKRRSILISGAAMSLFGPGAALAAACAQTQSQGRPTVNYLGSDAANLAWAKPARYFDSHTHVFNASDVPGRDFVRYCGGHVVNGHIPRIMTMLGILTAKLTEEFAETPKVEIAYLDAHPVLGGSTKMSSEAIAKRLDADIDARRTKLTNAIFHELTRGSHVELSSNIAQFMSAGRSSNLKSVNESMLYQYLRASLDAGSEGAQAQEELMAPGRKHDSAIARKARTIGLYISNSVKFVGHLLSYRHHNLHCLMQEYAKQSPDMLLSGCFTAMVDFKYSLGGYQHTSSMLDQVLIHERLADLSDGFMLPIVGYNPLAEVLDGGALCTVEDAIRNHGCVGVKIYPPMGFSPNPNKDVDYIDVNGKHQSMKAEKIRDALEALYGLCHDLDVPVMAHANRSMGRSDENDAMGSPTGWAAMADFSNATRPVTVHLGHFGGANDHGGAADGKWTDGFANLMKNKHVNVYGDVAFWSQILDKPDLQKRLHEVLDRKVNDTELVWDRVMYGSDWHMMSAIPHWSNYPSRMATIFRGFDNSPARLQKIFGDNVLNCYQLNPQANGFGNPSADGVKQSQNWQRLMAHYSPEKGRRLPGWLRTWPQAEKAVATT